MRTNVLTQANAFFYILVASFLFLVSFPSFAQKGNETASIERHRYWLNVTNPTGQFSQILVAYMTGATVGVDPGIDGLYMNDGAIGLSSLINGVEYAIQGRPLPFNPLDVVQLGFKTTISGTYTLAIDHVDGLFLAGQNIYMTDHVTGTYVNLSTGSYTFTSEAGVFNSRFEVGYQNTLTVEQPLFNANDVVVYNQNDALNINTGATNMKDIKVYDIQGRLLLEKNNLNATAVAISELRANQQIVIVQIVSNDNIVVVKKVIF